MAAQPETRSNGQQYSWQHMFVGRELDMAFLQERWEEARHGRPQVVVLLGESGLGKTRLVQEFYRWLSTNADPGGYWPDAFTDVNPQFHADHRPTASIPWLWWGIRWAKGRNRVGEVGLRDYRDKLLAHTEPITARRRLKQVAGTAGLTAANLASNLIPFANLIFAAKDLHSLAGNAHEGLDLLRRGPGFAFEAEQKQLVQLDALARDYFRTILDPKNKDAETVPIILLLDDAQWADTTTLRFVEQVTRDAFTHGWPLLVLVTHWEGQWYERLQQFPQPSSPPERLTDLFLSARNAGEAWKMRNIQPLRDLSAVVYSALPGLLPEQHQLVVNRAGGNPLFLEEILHSLLRMPNYFINNRCDQALQPKALRKISEQDFSLHALVQGRFNDLHENVRRVLGWSSVQGTRFLTAITQAAARKIAPELADEDVRDCLHQAESPHCLVQPIDGAGQFNCIEFRQAVFHEVARRSLEFNEDEQAAVQASIKEALIDWLTTDAIDQLPAAERRDALEMARVILRPDPDDGDNRWRAWGHAMIRLMQLSNADYLSDQACVIAREIADIRPDGWPVAILSASLQCEALDQLMLYRDFRRSRSLIKSLRRQNEEIAARSPSLESLRELSTSLEDEGHWESAKGRLGQALTLFHRSLKLREQIVAEFGETPESLHALAHSLDDVGIVKSYQGHPEQALDLFHRSLELCERIVAEFGETPENLRGVAIALNRIGRVQLSEGYRQEALAALHRSLEINDKIVRVFGETSERLSDLAYSLTFFANYGLDAGCPEETLALFHRSLELRERIVAGFGETPESLRNLADSLTLVGDASFVQGYLTEALAASHRSLELREQIIAEFGETPENLCELSIALDRAGRFELVDSNRDEGWAALRRCVDVNERIVAEFGETHESLRNLANSLITIGDTHFSEGYLTEALAAFHRSLELRERIIAKFGEIRGGLRKLSIVLVRAGGVELAQGHPQEALALFHRSLEIAEQIVAEFGETPESLHDLFCSLNRVGDIELDEGHPEEALTLFHCSLYIAERIAARFGATPERLCCIGASHRQVRNLELADGRQAEAPAAFRRGLEIHEPIVGEFGETPEEVDALARSAWRLGQLAKAEGDFISAWESFTTAQSLIHKIIDRGWSEPQDHEDLAMIDKELKRL
jgi:tetratricopeptide (TPR) repeat protein